MSYEIRQAKSNGVFAFYRSILFLRFELKFKFVSCQKTWSDVSRDISTIITYHLGYNECPVIKTIFPSLAFHPIACLGQTNYFIIVINLFMKCISYSFIINIVTREKNSKYFAAFLKLVLSSLVTVRTCDAKLFQVFTSFGLKEPRYFVVLDSGRSLFRILYWRYSYEKLNSITR